jgi:hypothetical protein
MTLPSLNLASPLVCSRSPGESVASWRRVSASTPASIASRSPELREGVAVGAADCEETPAESRQRRAALQTRGAVDRYAGEVRCGSEWALHQGRRGAGSRGARHRPGDHQDGSRRGCRCNAEKTKTARFRSRSAEAGLYTSLAGGPSSGELLSVGECAMQQKMTGPHRNTARLLTQRISAAFRKLKNPDSGSTSALGGPLHRRSCQVSGYSSRIGTLVRIGRSQ